MSFRVIAVSAMLCLTLVNCGLPTETPDPSSTSFFPLTIGNKWEYSNFGKSGIPQTWEVTGTRDIEGETFFEITKDRGRFATLVEYYRLASDTLYLYSELGLELPGRPNVKMGTPAIFSLGQNDTFEYRIFDMNYVVTVAELGSDRLMFSYDDPAWSDEEFVMIFERGIGLTRLYNPYFGGLLLELVEFDIK